MGAALLSQRGEILLTGFECIHFRSGRGFRIHREPDRPDHDADNTSRDILSDLGVILVREFFCLDVVRLDLGADHGAVALRVLWLYDRYGMRVAPRAGAQDKGECHRAQLPATQRTPSPSSPNAENVH